MKTILLATDYSHAANNALHYAIELAKQTKAKLILFHVYTIPVPVSDVQVMMPAVITELEKENTEKMKKLRNKVVKLTGKKIKVETLTSSGMPVHEILAAVKKTKADLVIIGMKVTGKFSRTLLGSTTTFLIKKAKAPVLIIPDRTRFRKTGKIVFAYDYRDPVKKDVLKRIKEFARILNVGIMVLNVVSFFEDPGYKKAFELTKLKKALKGIKHNFYFPASENVTDEISSFIRKQKAGMLVMLPHKYTAMEKLFYHSSDTKRMAFETKVPLLSLHD